MRELPRNSWAIAVVGRIVLGALILLCGPIDGAVGRATVAAAIRPAVVRLPIVDKQDIRVGRVPLEGGSLQSRVVSIAEDRYGFLWFGTDDGLYRYDGYKLRPYRRERGNPNSLGDDAVKVVYRDRSGILWVGTGFAGLDRLDPVSDTFRHYRHDSNDRGSLSDNSVNCIYQDAGGTLWVGTSGGLDSLDPGKGTFVHYRHNPEDSGSLSTNEVVDLFEDRSGHLWVGTVGGGLNRLDRSTGRFSKKRTG